MALPSPFHDSLEKLATSSSHLAPPSRKLSRRNLPDGDRRLCNFLFPVLSDLMAISMGTPESGTFQFVMLAGLSPPPFSPFPVDYFSQDPLGFSSLLFALDKKTGASSILFDLCPYWLKIQLGPRTRKFAQHPLTSILTPGRGRCVIIVRTLPLWELFLSFSPPSKFPTFP